MKMRLAALALASALMASPIAAQESDTVPDSEIVKMAQAACRDKDFSAFMGDFAQNAAVRKAFTADTVEIRKLSAPDQQGEKVAGKDYKDFQVQMIDFRFITAESWAKFEKTQNSQDWVDVSMEYKETGNDGYRVDWTRAEMKDVEEGQEFVRAIGNPGAYIFEFRDGCWRLTQDLR